MLFGHQSVLYSLANAKWAMLISQTLRVLTKQATGLRRFVYQIIIFNESGEIYSKVSFLTKRYISK